MKNKILFVIYSFCFLLCSCAKEEMKKNSNSPVEEQKMSDGMMVLGEKINDPYAIYNMRSAYAHLKSDGENTPIDEITPNKKYLRFLPKNEEELDLLKNDTSIILYDFPLDYEIDVQGTYYHDPELPETAITWQYCVIPIDKEIPDIQHELIYEVFIPDFSDNGNDTILKSSPAYDDFYEQLVYESYKLTNNIKPNENNLKGVFKNKRWNPSGRITVQDDILGTIPLEGANVHARWATHVEDCFTNSNGEFSMSGFLYEVNYSIKWERYHYSIRSGEAGQAWYNGPKKKGEWNLHITSGASIFYATIHRAAYHYYYGNIDGLKRPPEKSALKPQLKIAAINEENNDINGQHAAWKRVLGILNWIKIWNPQRDDDDIYATVIHELTHASHWDMNHSDFNDTDVKVKESWARGVQWWLTRRVYKNYRGGSTIMPIYTQIVVDLIDSKADDYTNYGAVSLEDQVTGYTIKEIEDALKGQKTWNSWRDNIKKKYTNGTEDKIDALFSYWE